MTLPPGYTLYPATPADAELIQAQRDALFTDMGRAPEMILAVSPASLAWLQDALECGTYHAWLVQDARGEAVAGAGVTWLQPGALQPSPFNQGAARAYLDNVYVHPQHRRRGLARALTLRLLADCAARGVRLVTLHASEAGRPLYEQLGFSLTPEMTLLLPGGPGGKETA